MLHRYEHRYNQYRDFEVLLSLSTIVCVAESLVLYLSPGNMVLWWLQVDSKENMAKFGLLYVMLFICLADIVYLSSQQKSLKFAILVE